MIARYQGTHSQKWRPSFNLEHVYDTSKRNFVTNNSNNSNDNLDLVRESELCIPPSSNLRGYPAQSYQSRDQACTASIGIGDQLFFPFCFI